MSPESFFVRRGWLALAPILGTIALVLAVATRYVHHLISGPAILAAWWIGNAMLLLFVLAFLKGRRIRRQPMATGRIVAIVAAHEQDTDDLTACIWSILNQRGVEVDEVHVVDDGSTQRPVQPFAHPRIRWHRTKNSGGHAAAGYVLDRLQPGDWDFVLILDADYVLEPRAMARQLKAFSRPGIAATIGKVIARNPRPNLLTRIADLNLGTSAAMPAARRSPAHLIKLVSGMPVIYRAGLPFQHRRRFLAGGGHDDYCRLAIDAALEGEVVAVSNAIASAPAAADARTAYRRRLAWSALWWRTVWQGSTRAGWRRGGICRLLALTHLVVIPVATAYAVVAIAVSVWRDGPQWPAITIYAAFYLLMRYAAAALHLMGRPAASRRRKIWTWLLLTPAEAAVNLMLVIPIKYGALIALCVHGWRARLDHKPAPLAQLGSVYYSGYLPDVNGS
ncbi:glycosyltransferase [Actinoplanes sp. NPDC026619]|uniref:glycosyltransferase n=1 Tax=Actinoplanes sp. NPDC026619 TaxID=3155798 RepID=UPI0033E62AF6